jgi:hypothetical protein
MKSAARRWGALLALPLLALAPAPAVTQEQRVLTLEISLPDFIQLQRLDDGDRRVLLGLPATCTPGLTAMAGATDPSRRLFVVVVCEPNAEN